MPGTKTEPKYTNNTPCPQHHFSTAPPLLFKMQISFMMLWRPVIVCGSPDVDWQQCRPIGKFKSLGIHKYHYENLRMEWTNDSAVPQNDINNMFLVNNVAVIIELWKITLILKCEHFCLSTERSVKLHLLKHIYYALIEAHIIATFTDCKTNNST